MFNLFRRTKRPRRWQLSDPLITFGRHDRVSIGDGFEGICVFGGVGSGKTSGSGFAIASSLIGYGFGGLVLTTKTDEVDRWIRLCRLFNRENDLIIFDVEHNSEFSFLDHQRSCQKSPVGMTENLVNLVEEMMEVSSRASGLQANRGDEAFWANARRSNLRNNIGLLAYAFDSIRMDTIVEVLGSAPKNSQMAESAEWRESSPLISAIQLAKLRHAHDEFALHDITSIERYFLNTLPRLAEKTRSIVESSVYSILELFTSGVLFRLYGRGSNVSPFLCRQGKIIVVNQPVKRDLAIGLIGQTIWKTQFQQTMELDSGRDVLPCFLYIDECQQFLTTRDAQFAATARSSRCINIWLTQNINNMYASMGADESGRAAANSLLGLANTKIFHQNSDQETNNYAAELFGRRKQMLCNTSMQQPEKYSLRFYHDDPIISTGMSEAYEFIVPPDHFTTLKKGGLPDLTTEAFVYCGGRRWRSSQDTYLLSLFKQGF